MDQSLGLDIGSVIAKAILLDNQARIVGRWETRSRGRPADAIFSLLKKCMPKIVFSRLRIGLTGYGREGLSVSEDIFSCNEIAALSYGASQVDGRAQSVIEVGGQSTQWIHLRREAEDAVPGRFLDFVISERCAAGSGAFIEQQASRLKLDVKAFSKLASRAATGSPSPAAAVFSLNRI